MSLQHEWARLIVGAFAESGGTDVVITPGSRSTPFVLAACSNDALRCHELIDERSAGFFALGRSKTTGRPTMLLCTSGSAPAHYYPAVIEASMAYAPLLILSADRPLELQGCGATQTINQTKLFGDHVRYFAELGHAEPTHTVLRAARRMVAQAYARCISPEPGPVHLNVRARKPLEPSQEIAFSGVDIARAVHDEPVAKVYVSSSLISEAALSNITDACASTERGLIVCGPASIGEWEDRASVISLAEATGFPLVVEAASQMRFCDCRGFDNLVIVDAVDAVFRSRWIQDKCTPELVLQFGMMPISTGWDQYLTRHASVPRYVIAAHGWHDPYHTARAHIQAGLADSANRIAVMLKQRTPSKTHGTEWASVFSRANKAAWHCVENELRASADALTEGAVAREAVASLPKQGILALGNSLAIREVDAFCQTAASDVFVLHQRGAAGIDGLISGAAGAITNGKPCVLLLGDVSFLHDLTGLYAARHAQTPFAIVVVNNNGGRIFEQLPIAKNSPFSYAMNALITPHGLSFEHAAKMFGCEYAQTRTVSETRRALQKAMSQIGCTIVEAIVAPSNAFAQNERIWKALNEELSRV